MFSNKNQVYAAMLFIYLCISISLFFKKLGFLHPQAPKNHFILTCSPKNFFLKITKINGLKSKIHCHTLGQSRETTGFHREGEYFRNFTPQQMVVKIQYGTDCPPPPSPPLQEGLSTGHEPCCRLGMCVCVCVFAFLLVMQVPSCCVWPSNRIFGHTLGNISPFSPPPPPLAQCQAQVACLQRCSPAGEEQGKLSNLGVVAGWLAGCLPFQTDFPSAAFSEGLLFVALALAFRQNEPRLAAFRQGGLPAKFL